MSNIIELQNFINEPHCDLGENSWILLNLVKTMNNARFMDLGVRFGPSSAILSYESKERNNQVCGCDLMFDGFNRMGARFVNENYLCYQADSVTLGKNWDEDPFDIIFVDTLHFKEQVLSELYFWSKHIKKDGYFIFHDSHWEPGSAETHGGIEYGRVEEAIMEFFMLDKLVDFEDKNLNVKCYPESYGMTFVQIKNLSFFDKCKKNIKWDDVFSARNTVNNLHFNRENINFSDWGKDIDLIENELKIFAE